MKKHIIAVVEDDEDIRNNVCRFAQKSGFECWCVGSAEDFYVRLLREKADLVVVDLGLPGEDGLSLVRRLVTQKIPVVVQTAQGALEQRIAGLEAGALQYFVKPTDLNELMAGIRSLLRNTPALTASEPKANNWRLDRVLSELHAPNDKCVRLISRELELLDCLMEAKGSVITKQQVLEATGHLQPGVESEIYQDEAYRRIESMLSRLRRKTLDSTGERLPIRSVFGRGLAFVTA